MHVAADGQQKGRRGKAEEGEQPEQKDKGEYAVRKPKRTREKSPENRRSGHVYSALNSAGARAGSPEIIKSEAVGTNAALSRVISAVGIVDRSQTNKR
jgi:hypothetical protein